MGTSTTQKEMLRAIYIDSKSRIVFEGLVPAKDSIPIREWIGGKDRLLTTLILDNKDIIYLDDEGLINGTEDFFFFQGAAQPFAGNGVILGPVDETGYSTGAQSDLKSISSRVEFAHGSELDQERLEELCNPKIITFGNNSDFEHYLSTGELRNFEVHKS